MRRKHLMAIGLMLVLFVALTMMAWLKEADTYSDSERRTLVQFPELSIETIINGEFMGDFETYAQDQFPLREAFRRLKSRVVYHVLMQKDNNNIYIVDRHASKMEYPLNEVMLEHAADVFREVYDMYLKENGGDTYFSIVPDKNYYLAEENGYLELDYEKLIMLMKEKTSFMEYVDITETLALEDYYFTDTHWRQEDLLDTAKILADAMGVSVGIDFKEQELEIPFYGVYFGQSALPLEPDTIRYLTNKTLEACKVTCFDKGTAEILPLYDMDKAGGKDAYEMFLSGTRAILTIENPLATSDKKLVVFRDSFASSVIPLLLEGYSEITLIDLRYIDKKMIGDFVDFEGKDALFLYSTLILNNSLALK